MLQVDLSAVDPRVVEELVKGRHAQDALTLQRAPENQLRVARQNQTDWRSLDGLGAPTLSITPEAYHYWGQRFSYDAQGNYIGDGYACWRDPQFLAEFKRDNPACRINAKGTRIQVGASAARGDARPTTEEGTARGDARPTTEEGTALRDARPTTEALRFRKSYG